MNATSTPYVDDGFVGLGTVNVLLVAAEDGVEESEVGEEQSVLLEDGTTDGNLLSVARDGAGAERILKGTNEEIHGIHTGHSLLDLKIGEGSTTYGVTDSGEGGHGLLDTGHINTHLLAQLRARKEERDVPWQCSYRRRTWRQWGRCPWDRYR